MRKLSSHAMTDKRKVYEIHWHQATTRREEGGWRSTAQETTPWLEYAWSEFVVDDVVDHYDRESPTPGRLTIIHHYEVVRVRMDPRLSAELIRHPGVITIKPL